MTFRDPPILSIGQCATLACLLEVNAPKLGNVHRAADFDDATLNDFSASAVVVGPILQRAAELGVGRCVLECVRATRQVSLTNTNLGTVLLLAPLALAAQSGDISARLAGSLESLTADDAADVYEAIRLAAPGGIGDIDALDVRGDAPDSLITAMEAAADRDRVARQYVTNFEDIFQTIVPSIVSSVQSGLTLPQAIVHTQVQLLASFGDSLITRKAGSEINEQCRARAGWVLAAGSPEEENYHTALSDFDFWLRSDGRRRNPGTTADLIAAGLFVGLHEGLLTPPFG